MLIPFQYLWQKYCVQTSGVLHLGANTGQEARAYAKQGVQRVIWVEAMPTVYLQLVENIKNYPGSVALLGCLSDTDGQKVKFNISSNGSQSSSFLEFGTHTQEHPTVKYVGSVEMVTVRLDTLLVRNCIEIAGDDWFLNVDLQGAELLALKGMGPLLHKFKYAYIEINEKELYKGCPLAPEIDGYMQVFGFKTMETEMTGSGWGDRFYQRT